MPFHVLGSGPRLVCQLIPRTPKGLQTGSIWGREPSDLPPGLLPHQPNLDPRNPHPCLCQCHLITSAASPGAPSPLCPFSLRACTASLHSSPPTYCYSSTDLVGAAHLARAHPAGALFCGPW